MSAAILLTDYMNDDDYSQFGEQQYILDAVGDAVGSFLDIGAWNPTTFSMTRALYERGWSGLMIEPSPEPFLSLLREYGREPRIKLLCAAVGFERNAIEMHATANAVTTSDEATYQKWRETVNYTGKFYAAQLTLEEISNQFGGFQMVSIDAEGVSVNLAMRYLELGHRPRCLVVEHDDRDRELQEYALARGYKTVHINGTNVVLVM